MHEPIGRLVRLHRAIDDDVPALSVRTWLGTPGQSEPALCSTALKTAPRASSCLVNSHQTSLDVDFDEEAENGVLGFASVRHACEPSWRIKR